MNIYIKILISFIVLFSFWNVNINSQKWVSFSKDGLVYETDEQGNHIPDFSYSGYKQSDEEIPLVEGVIELNPIKGDATLLIQTAIDYVSSLPLNKDGFRGAIQLSKGVFEVNGDIKINSSGIVIRGSGIGKSGTTIVATGRDRRTLIQILGKDYEKLGKKYSIEDNFLPINSKNFNVDKASNFQVGDEVIIHRVSTQKWIDRLGMSEPGGKESSYIGWKPGQRDIFWKRKISSIKNHNITVDVPLTMEIDSTYAEYYIYSYSNKGVVKNIGVENLNLISNYDSSNLKDEDHSFNAIDINFAEDVWVRRVHFSHFAGSAVAIYENGRRVTVEDCISKNPISEIANWRRYSFFTMGEQTLFKRIYSEKGYHDFAVGFCAAGPNVFVDCEAKDSYNFSGAIDSWSTGVLFDLVRIDGNNLSFSNRLTENQGSGWTTGNSIFWQCSASKILNFSPPGSRNWAIGCWGQFYGDGEWASQNSHLSPRSLFYAQLAERHNKSINHYCSQVRQIEGIATTSPTIEQAQLMSEAAKEPYLSHKEWIEHRIANNPLLNNKIKKKVKLNLENRDNKSEKKSLQYEIKNGWITVENKLLVGKRSTEPWWRGVARPYEVQKANNAITRFVPGRYGKGYTDNLDDYIAFMQKNNIAIAEHNYGLWYDRRRDDHQRVRRDDGDAWAPFYDQPFARSGEGVAWDGLSKYDLNSYNYFYWNRLNSFAKKASYEGKVLFLNHFFQHNILEAGAHWVDSPWRRANNLNQTDFLEPLNFAGDKRIFIAEQFYDLSNENHKQIYKNYIRQSLSSFEEDMPVMHLISAEYTGPLHFVEFWIDVIAEWEQETGRHAWVVLSTTKDVQDAILLQENRSKVVDVIDIRFWAEKSDGTLYAPEGGMNLAPRQHARIMKSGKRSFQSVYNSVIDYKNRFPEKAVIYSESRYDQYNWAVLMAGGSLPAFNFELPKFLLEEIINLRPLKTEDFSNGNYYLADDNHNYFIYNFSGEIPPISVTGSTKFKIYFIDIKDGKIIKEKEIISEENQLIISNSEVNQAILIKNINR